MFEKRSLGPERLAIRGVNIVIPVFNQLDLVRQCLSSVFAAQTDVEHDVTVVNDGSTQPGVARYLRRLASQSRIVLVENSKNVGFVKSVNKGMRLSAGLGVVLLNSDTIVYDRWLDRLTATALRDPRIATVNPLTNQNGSHISCYPDRNWHEGKPLEVGDAVLNEIAGQVNRGCRAYVHTTVGFCMFIKMDAIKHIGIFDSRYFPYAYGEESDFCYRATKVGWRHAVCGDAFVTHLHGRSFGSRKEGLRQEMIKTFRKLHPEQPHLDAEFRKLNPVAKLRENLDLGRLRRMLAGRNALVLTSDEVGDQRADALDVRLQLEENRVAFRFGLAEVERSFPNLRCYDLSRDIVRLNRDLSFLGISEIQVAKEVPLDRFRRLARGWEFEIGLSAAVSSWGEGVRQKSRLRDTSALTQS
jgi:GT2 family glycosyltransferase